MTPSVKSIFSALKKNNSIIHNTRKSIQDIQNIKNTFRQKGGKTNVAFSGGSRRVNGIFNTGKTAYSIEIANYYEKINGHPLKDLIRGLFAFDNSLIKF